MRNFKWRYVFAGIFIILLVVLVGFLIWAAIPSGASMPEAMTALQSDQTVTVTQNDFLIFEPAGETPAKGLIFYPGGRVLVDSYAPTLRGIAEAGYLVVGVPMPLNLAIFNPNAAGSVIERFPEIEHWAIGGHSLGGAMAPRFAKDNPDTIDGLILWASYPEASSALSGRDDLTAVSIYGTLDGVADLQTILDSAEFLPESTEFVAIEGGNHAYFGWYGDQAGDNPATITREEQTGQIINASVNVMEAMGE